MASTNRLVDGEVGCQQSLDPSPSKAGVGYSRVKPQVSQKMHREK